MRFHYILNPLADALEPKRYLILVVCTCLAYLSEYLETTYPGPHTLSLSPWSSLNLLKYVSAPRITFEKRKVGLFELLQNPS